MIAYKSPEDVMEIIKKEYHIKGEGPPDYYLSVCLYVCMSVGPVSKIPKLINYRVVLFHTLNSGLVDL